MTLFLRIMFNIVLILIILSGIGTTQEIDETDPAALLKRGIAFGGVDNYNRSIAYFDKAIEIEPRYAEAYYARGRAYYYKGWYDKAIADFTKAIEINPSYAEAYNSRGHMKRRKYKDLEGAIADYTMAIEVNQKFAGFYHNRAYAYYHKGQYLKACSDWKRACKLKSCGPYEAAKRKGICK